MSAIDIGVILWVVVAAVYGMFRGMVSQFVAIIGIVCAFLFSSSLAPWLSPHMKDSFGFSKFIADKSSIFLAGLSIYFLFKVLGFAIERLLIGKSKGLKSANRMGGAILGGVKGLLLVVFLFGFITILPVAWVKSWLPKLPQSYAYQAASKFNPMGNAPTLEKMRRVRTAFSEPKKLAKLKKSKEVGEILKKHNMPGMLEDDRLGKAIKDGDYETLHKNPEFEKVIKEDRMAEILDQIEKESK